MKQQEQQQQPYRTFCCAAFGKHWKKQPTQVNTKKKERIQKKINVGTTTSSSSSSSPSNLTTRKRASDAGNQGDSKTKQKLQRLQQQQQVLAAHRKKLRQDRREGRIITGTTVTALTNRAQDNDNKKTTVLPPTLIVPTASPHVFVARRAVQLQDEEEASTAVHADQLFADVVQSNFAIPALFRTGGTFQYYGAAKFRHSLPTTTSTQDEKIPEVAVLGRSNVGKSSLINALTRSDMARVSKQPGRTQQVHYYGFVPQHQQQQRQQQNSGSCSKNATSTATTEFNVNNALGFLVDLPGYGYAVGPDSVVDSWQKETQRFLLSRHKAGHLRRLFLLVDARHGGPLPLDLSVMTWLDQAEIPFTVVLTKTDATASLPVVIKAANQIAMRYHQDYAMMEEAILKRQLNHNDNNDDDDLDDQIATVQISPIIHLTSSKTGQGIAELLSSLEAEFLTTIVDEEDDDDDEDYDEEEDYQHQQSPSNNKKNSANHVVDQM